MRIQALEIRCHIDITTGAHVARIHVYRRVAFQSSISDNEVIEDHDLLRHSKLTPEVNRNLLMSQLVNGASLTFTRAIADVDDYQLLLP